MGQRQMKKSNPTKTGGNGAKRMKEFGYKCVTVWLDPAEAKAIEEAASRCGMKLATFVRKVAFDASTNGQGPLIARAKLLGDLPELHEGDP